MFESVARAAADDPHIRIARMPVDDEVVVGCIFVLADAGFDQRRIFHPRKTVREITARLGQPILAHQALP